MDWASIEARHGLRSGVLVLAAMVAALTLTTSAADARHRHGHGRVEHEQRAQSSGHSGGYSPRTASIVVDGNTGAILEDSNPDAPRHPASLTKVMTLYLLFERLDAGKIKLDTPLTVSAHAAAQAPTKLELKPGQTISVENAIKGIVTRSANDAAVVIAENLGGSEQAFAALMTQKARALGMNHTTYVNASGLPDDDQITTARDQALLGRAIQDRFPRYYKFFSTTSFVFRGETIRGHDHLLGEVEGVDGIKTGFTEASGFNLITSVHRDGRYLLGVVLGGRSAGERDAHMRALIAANIELASARRSAPLIAERAMPKAEPQHGFGKGLANKALANKVLANEFAAEAPPSAPPDAPSATSANAPAVVGSNEPIHPVVVKTVTYRAVTVRSPSIKPMPVLVPVTPSVQEPASVVQEPASAPPPPVQTSAPALPVQTAAAALPVQTPAATLPIQTPLTVVASAGPGPKVDPAPAQNDQTASTKPEASPKPAEAYTLASASSVPQEPPQVHHGWIIQIGAYGGEDEARQHLNEAQQKLHAMLASADPFTERVQKGDTTFYRARFAGFDKSAAEAACRQLKRSDFACMALKD
jgi:D-alanyl-D-alanine carboxypeptidase